ncbi:hypothetical protein [Bradyrhizobium guangzhouense]|uniref:Uncharacterized protein n=1 Tax=Bradyrhizobium guangzhouense TaxID=1325095 RepID=A0AAE6C7X9_9BRAD|nr:hypothetical protein [Bradyrhizobium guangzhouense]QAU45896.1 hypothetical protein XH91_11360 [Bradyrhizobium guangzhouense]
MGKKFDYRGLPEEQQAKLRGLCSSIHSAGCRNTAGAAEMGNAFNEAKIGLDHGQFTSWCYSEAGYEIRQVQNMMNLANFAGKEPDILLVPMSAGFLLAAPSAPKLVVEKVLKVAREGGRVRVTWVKQLLKPEREKEPAPERSTASEAAKIAKLIAGVLHPGEAVSLRQLLEAADASLIQRFVSDLQENLRAALPGAVSSDNSAHRPSIGY